MADVVVVLKVMPTSPDVDVGALAVKVKEEINNFVDDDHKDGEIKQEINDFAFGLKELRLTFVMSESTSNTDPLESAVSGMDDVESAEVVDVRRAIG